MPLKKSVTLQSLIHSLFLVSYGLSSGQFDVISHKNLLFLDFIVLSGHDI